MDKREVAEMLGLKSFQQVDHVLAGRRNFSYPAAKKATALLGGSLAVWQDEGMVEKRRALYEKFKTENKSGRGNGRGAKSGTARKRSGGKR